MPLMLRGFALLMLRGFALLGFALLKRLCTA